jgi:hypothetical protein
MKYEWAFVKDGLSAAGGTTHNHQGAAAYSKAIAAQVTKNRMRVKAQNSACWRTRGVMLRCRT